MAQSSNNLSKSSQALTDTDSDVLFLYCIEKPEHQEIPASLTWRPQTTSDGDETRDWNYATLVKGTSTDHWAT